MSGQPPEDGLVCAFLMDGAGSGRALDWDGLRSWRPADGSAWVHLDRSSAAAREWLRRESGLSQLACNALLAEETRPRVDRLPEGLIVVFRGVNLNPGADPEDMVSLRLWVEAQRLISVRHRRLMAIQDVRDLMEAGAFPTGPSMLLAEIGRRLAWRMEPVIIGLSDRVDDLEEEVLSRGTGEIRSKLAALRREIISLRRYLAPQRDAMLRLQAETAAWMLEESRLELREAADQTTRYLEDLDAAREHVSVAHEELVSRLSEQLNQRMYLLSVIAAIFLPLGLITGLLGINVGGLPGAGLDSAFLIVCLVLVAVGGGLVLLLRRFHFF